mgnify:FL=1
MEIKNTIRDTEFYDVFLYFDEISAKTRFGEGRYIGKMAVDSIIFISFEPISKILLRDSKDRWFNYVEPMEMSYMLEPIDKPTFIKGEVK